MRQPALVPRVASALLLVAFAVSGCTLINPHVTWKHPKAASPTSEDKLRWSIAYADNAKAAYQDALGTQSSLGAWLGIGLVPLAAAAAGLGIMGGEPAAIAALGLTGAAAYGVGTWLNSKPAQRAWVAGYNATTCAVDAILPLLVIEDEMATIQNDIAAIDTTEVERRTRNLDRFHNREDLQKEWRDQADAAKTSAETLVAGAKSVKATANETLVDARGAGRRLKEAVDNISGKVSAALVENGPDLQALSSIIGGLSRSYGQFVQIPDSVKPTPTTKTLQITAQSASLGDETTLSQELLDLSDETAKLAKAVDKVTGPINAVAKRKPVETLKACGVSPEQIGLALSVDPPGRIEIDQGTAASVTRYAKGGAAPYAVAITGSAVDGLRVQQTAPFGPVFVVETTDKTPAVTRTVIVSDRSGNNAVVDVQVKPKAAGPPAGQDAPKSDGAKAKTLEELANLLPRPAVTVTGGTVTYIDATVHNKTLDALVIA